MDPKRNDALRRVGTTPDDAVMWLMEFVRMNLVGLSETGWNKLRWETIAFQLGARGLADRREPIENLMRATVQQWQARLRQMLGMAARREPCQITIVKEWRLSMHAHSRLLTIKPVVTEMTFMKRAEEVLVNTTRQILRCPGCGEFFVKHHKRKYCSPQCSNRNRVRVFRGRHKKRRPTQASFLTHVPSELPVD